MLGILASIALVVGGVSATMVLSEDERLVAEETNQPVVEVLAVEIAEPREQD